MRKLFLLLSLIAFTNPAFAGQLETVTKDNWLGHPEIKKVREVYKAVREGIKSGSFRKSVREFEYCEPYEDMLRLSHTDRKGLIRHYRFEGGSGDSAVDRDLYYDEKGTLRFVFITAGAFNNTRIEHRIYLDAEGRRVWEIQKLLEGPGYTFPKVWHEDEMIRDPEKAFSSPNTCPEKKAGHLP